MLQSRKNIRASSIFFHLNTLHSLHSKEVSKKKTTNKILKMTNPADDPFGQETFVQRAQRKIKEAFDVNNRVWSFERIAIIVFTLFLIGLALNLILNITGHGGYFIIL